MKKIFTLALLAVFALVSCTPNSKDPVDPYPEACDKHDVDWIAAEVSGMYYGNAYSASENVYNYGVVLAGHSNVYDLMTGGVDLLPDNQYLFLDIFSEVASTNYSISFKLPNGVYNLDVENTTNALTLGSEYSYIISVNADNEVEETRFTNGTVTITDNLIEAMLLGVDGKMYHIQCPNNVVDNSATYGAMELEGYPSTLEGNHTVSYTEGNCEVWAEPYGDYLGVNKNMWVLYVDEFKADGSIEEIQLMLLVDPAKESPAGTYEISGDITKETALFGYIDPFYGQFNGCWWMTLDAEWYTTAYAPLKSGSVTLTVEGEICSVSVNAVDDLGNKVTGTCNNASYVYAGAGGYSLSKCSTAAKAANHVKKVNFAPRKVKISSLIKK